MTYSSRQNKILVDTNAYFRLAQSLHPLLSVPFGKENNCLYVLPELEKEWKYQPRLKTKFCWVMDEQYIENRKGKILISKEQKSDIERAFEFMKPMALSIDRTPSDVDIRYCAYGYVLKYPVVTDDRGMTELGNLYDVNMMSTLRLLSLMKNAEHITMGKIEEIAEFIDYSHDIPANFFNEYKSLFCKDAPRYKR